MQAWIARSWLSRGLPALLLWPVSLLYRVLWSARQLAYARGWKPSTRLPVPVLVIGNVVAGGTGKTPVVIAIARHLQQRGLRVGVVSRGHGRQTSALAGAVPDVVEVRPDSQAQDCGDEPLLIRRATHAPVFVGRQRVAAAHALLQRHPDVQIILSDDGLQHLALQRDVEICVFDERSLGNGFLLPAGPLREPWPRGSMWRGGQPTGRAFVLYRGQAPRGVEAGTAFEARRGLADHALSVDGIRVPLADLAGRELVALAGIAQPDAFFAMLRAQGLPLADTLALPDHYDFRSFPWASLKAKTLICTEKDAVKLARLKTGLEVFAVPLLVEIPAAFWAALDASLEPVAEVHREAV